MLTGKVQRKQSIRGAAILDPRAAIISQMEIPGHEIQRCIGQGGMATAYLARQTSLDRQVVLKVLDTATTDSPVTVERFLNEARMVASLQHPHIITIYDVGTADTDVYISMEFVDGGDLKERLKEQVFAPAEAVDMITKIASGLAAAHAKGIVHRDVKPGNILFRGDGTPLISDFGIAKRLTGDADLTTTGMFVGSPNYMAPEQSDVGQIDGRADIYSLGVIFFEMLTCRKPYQSDSVIDVILKHKKDPVPELPAGLEGYQGLLNLMMAKDRNDRFRDAESLLHFIDRLAERGIIKTAAAIAQEPDFDITSEEQTPAETNVTRVSLRPGRSRKLQPLLSAIAILCAVVYGVLILIERRLTEEAVPRVVPAAATIAIISEDPWIASQAGSESVGLPGARGGKVAGALLWLGTHSLNEYRLTAPPKDNAYYYFSRLLQMEPGSEDARQGLLGISERYVILAEREVAEGNHDQARSYITIGLQVNPKNERLLVLRDLADPGDRGLLATFFSIFK